MEDEGRPSMGGGVSSLSQGSEFLLVCRLEREDGSGPVEARKGPGFQL